MHLVGQVHVENFENAVPRLFNINEIYNDPSCGLIVTLVSRPNTAGTLPSGLVRTNNDTALVIGDHSEVRIQFKDQSGKATRVNNLSFYWATHPEYTAADAEQDRIDKAANRITFDEPIRMELRRENKAYAFNTFSPPVNSLAMVELKDIVLDEILFTTSRRGKVSFDHFNWSIA